MSGALAADLLGVGVCAPGMADADALRAWLTYADAPLPGGRDAQPAAARMAAAERRRAPHSVRMAVETATQVLGAHDAAAVGAVFASAYGDMANADAILTALARAPQEVSPTRFTHSVHNAAAGHWSMASASHAATTALAGGSEGFGGALLAALLELQPQRPPQLLVVYDVADAGALAEAAPCTADFAAALLLAPPGTGAALARLRAEVRARRGTAATPPVDARLLPWWQGNPAARALPLLEAVLCRRRHGFTWPLGSGTLLALDCEPVR